MKQIGKLLTGKSKDEKAYFDFLNRRKKIDASCNIKDIAIIYYIPKSSTEKYNNWEDGFTKAIDLLEEDYNVTWINLEDKKPLAKELNKFDFLIVKSCWDWIVDKYIRDLKGLTVSRGIAISCSLPPKKEWAWFYDVLWYETEWYKAKIKYHPNTFLAFGINSDKFKPMNLEKKYDVLGIGALTSKKRFNKFNELTQKKKLIIGSTNSHDFSTVKENLNSNIEIVEYASQDDLAKYINESKLVYIPSELEGGGERAVLEAISCGVEVKVENDNTKLKSLINGNSLISKYDYFFGLKRGIESLMKDNVYSTNLMFPEGNFKVGRNSFYNKNFRIKGNQNVSIGSYCSFGENISIITENHDTNYASTQGYIYRKNLNQNHPGESSLNPTKERTKGPVIIGNDVWIGDDVTILSGVRIGDGACIATKSLVSKNVTSYSVVGGIPSKLLKKRFSHEIISLLEDIKWWNWSDNKIKKNKEFFNLNLNEVDSKDIIKILK